MNLPIMFLDQDNKTKLVAPIFSYFLELLWERILTLKSVIVITVITVITSLHYQGLIKLSYLHCSCSTLIQQLNKENLKVIKNTLPSKLANPKSPCFIYCFKSQVITEKHCVAKVLQWVGEILLYENKRNYNSYKFSWKFAFTPFLSFCRNQISKLKVW